MSFPRTRADGSSQAGYFVKSSRFLGPLRRLGGTNTQIGGRPFIPGQLSPYFALEELPFPGRRQQRP